MNPVFAPPDPDYVARVTRSFDQQKIMPLLGAELVCVKPGHCTIRLPFRQELGQQNGFFHAGVTSTIADSAGGYAGFSLMPANSNVLTVEFKINLLRPAGGDEIIATGEVIKPGRSLFYTEVSVLSVSNGSQSLCARMSQTLAVVASPDPKT